MFPLAFAVVCAVFISATVYLVADLLGGTSAQVERRLKVRLENLLVRKAKIERTTNFSSIFSINQALSRQSFSKKLLHLLHVAGWTIPVSVFIMGDFLLGGLVYLLSALFLRNPFASFGISLLAMFIPYWVLILNKKRYISKFTMGLPDTLMLMKNAIQAGQGIQSAFQMVAQEGPKPVAQEMGQVIHEIELGNSLVEALGELYKRIGTLDLRIFVLGIFIQHEVGGNLVELFDHVEKTIRERITMSREINVLSAQGKMTGIVLFLLPMVLAGVLMILNPKYFDPLLDDASGKNLLIVSLGLQLVGGWIIRKIVTFNVA